MSSLKRFSIIVAITLSAVLMFGFVMPSITSAQPTAPTDPSQTPTDGSNNNPGQVNPDDDKDGEEDDEPETDENGNEIIEYYDGREISPNKQEEIYFWDKRKPVNPEDTGPEIETTSEGTKLETVIVGKGGMYSEEVIFRKDPKQHEGGNTDVETYTPHMKKEEHEHGHYSLILPIKTKELEYDKGEEKGCGLQGLPLNTKADSNGFRNNLTLNVYKYHKGAYLDLIGDGSENHQDNFEFIWMVAVDKESNEVLAIAPRSYVYKRAMSPGSLADVAVSGVQQQLDSVGEVVDTLIRPWEGVDKDKLNPFNKPSVLLMEPLIQDTGKTALDDDRNYRYEVHTCILPFKKSFKSSAPAYAVDALDSAATEGTILGKKGMKLNDWTRRADNQRSYLAMDLAARNVTMRDVCAKHPNPNKCNTTLSKDFRSCYFRAIGLKTSNTGLFSFEPIRDHEYFKIKDFESEVWMHSIKANTDAFISCFAMGDQAGRIGVTLESFSGSNRVFSSRTDARNYAEKVVTSTQWPESIHPIDNLSEMPETSEALTRCSLGSIGWIMCPILQFSAKIADRLFSYLKDWMTIPPLHPGDDQAAYVAWKSIRDIANVLFATVLLFTILIQSAGGTLSRYSVRKLAPRVAIVAILINISFPIASIIVDISNILGDSLYSLIHNLAPPTSGVSNFKTWETIVVSTVFTLGPVAAGAATTLTVLAALVPMLITSLFSMLIVFIILILRQAVVILLVVISPIAFAAQLLPGTEQWFKKWKDTFIQLTFMYPAIAVVFGGSYFASRTISNAGSQHGGFEGAMLAIFALAVQVIPLFITPIVMKIGGRAINSFGGSMQSKARGLSQKAARPVTNKINDIDQIRNIKAAQRSGILGKRRRKKMIRDGVATFRKSEETRSQTRKVSESDTLRGIAKVSAGGFDNDNRDLAEAALASQLRQIKQEGIQAARLNLDKSDLMFEENIKTEDIVNQLESTLDSDSIGEVQKAANIKKLAAMGSLDSIHKAIDMGKNLSDTERAALAEAIKEYGMGNDALHLSSDEALRSILNGEATTKGLYQNAYKQGGYTPEVVTRQSPQAVRAMKQNLDRVQFAEVQRNFETAKQDPKYAQHISPALNREMES